jgi:hypothetical protein
MAHRGPVRGLAHAPFNDYIGTVAADDLEAVKRQPSLHELANIDRDLYTIVAVDLRIDGPVTATVYAVDRFSQGLGPHGDVAKLGESDGEIPVVAFDLPEPNVEDFIRRAFRRISIRLVAQLFRDQVLAITEPEERGLAPSSPTDPGRPPVMTNNDNWWPGK